VANPLPGTGGNCYKLILEKLKHTLYSPHHCQEIGRFLRSCNMKRAINTFLAAACVYAVWLYILIELVDGVLA